MTKIVTFVSVLMTSVVSLAQPNYELLSSRLYPSNQANQEFMIKLFEILDLHKGNDPLLEGKGPSIFEFSLDKIKFALITNESTEGVDLVFFNWNLPLFNGLEVHPEFTLLYGKTVYILKNISKKAIATQGENNDQLTNFSYLLGANYVAKQVMMDAPPGTNVPEQLLNWKPHEDYMDRSHPLRQTLDAMVLVILSPDKELFFNQLGVTKTSRPYFEMMLASQGGFYNSVMGMIVHEMFHVKEGEDQVNDLAKRRKIKEDRMVIVDQLKADSTLRRLMGTYIKIVFSIGDCLKGNLSQDERQQLSDLKLVISEMKSKYPEAWKFIWNYEYTEGFAEYVSAYSMIQVGITSLEEQIDLQKSDNANNFAYRTGTLGGLYLANRLMVMPFKNNEDHRESVWEIVFRLTQTPATQASLSIIEFKYSTVGGVDVGNEIKRVINYLISTSNISKAVKIPLSTTTN